MSKFLQLKMKWYRVVFVLSSIALVIGCAGPAPLGRAIQGSDEQNYVTLLSASDSPRETYFAWRASWAEDSGNAESMDAKLSTTKNPFKAGQDRAAVSRGAVIYKMHCAPCHGVGADGKGTQIPVYLKKMDHHTFGKRLTATLHRGAPKKWFKVVSEGATSEEVNEDGVAYAMPGFKDEFAREQIWLVVTYLQSLDSDIK